MNAFYFAVGCILVILVIYWGSAEQEPAALSKFFGRRPQDKGQSVPPQKKRGW
jgi:hypothetical protein